MPVKFVEMENEKRLLVLQQLIVFVLKMIVLVKTVFKLLELLVRLMVPIFVPNAKVDITKPVLINALRVVLHVDLVLVTTKLFQTK